MEFLSQGNFWIMFAIGFLGMVIHFLKKKIKGETPTEIWNYFRDNFKTTLMAFLVTFVGVVGYYTQMAQGTTADFITVFLIGFLFDSMLNKWETKESPI